MEGSRPEPERKRAPNIGDHAADGYAVSPRRTENPHASRWGADRSRSTTFRRAPDALGASFHQVLPVKTGAWMRRRLACGGAWRLARRTGSGHRLSTIRTVARRPSLDR